MKGKRTNSMTKARIQPFCRANIINIGYFDGLGVFPRTERNNALFLYNTPFCLIWKMKMLDIIKHLKN